MENKEFIAASQLPVTEAKEVNVLCLDNGELKQKPAGNLGGSGGGYVITDLTMEVLDYGIQVTINDNYDNFMPTLLNGGSVWLMSDELGGTGGIQITMWIYREELPGLMLIAFLYEGELVPVFCICTNGTWKPEA